MKIYIISVLLFLTINPLEAQPVRLTRSKIPPIVSDIKQEYTLSLTAFLEGYTNSNGTAMRNDLYPLTVTVELHNSNSPHALVESQTGVLSSTGTGTFTFTIASNGTPYYIVVKSSNTVETWSATPQSFTSGTMSYNFSTAAVQAYGSNMVQKGSTWCIYSGDVVKNATNIVDGSDVIAVDNDNTYGVTDNPVTDITGDGIVDGHDIIIVDNNNTYSINCAFPAENSSDLLFYGGQTYHIVMIGSQYWLKENLNVGTKIDGGVDQIGIGLDNIEKYCSDYDPNCDIFGGLYQWNEAMQFDTTSGVQGICPNGWHIPTLIDFITLATTVGNDGNALKEVGQDTYGTNTSGFSALLAGYSIGSYFGDPSSGNFWSSSEYNSDFVYNMSLYYNDSYIYQGIAVYFPKTDGYSVRCIKN